MTKQICAVFTTALLIAGSSCTNKVTRIDPVSTTDLSGAWNDTDSRLVAQEMIADCMSRPWLARDYPSKRPTLIVGNIRNQSHEHINVQTFVKDMERELLNSGVVDFVASKSERVQLREEKADMNSGTTSEATRKELDQESGADLMLIGSINTIADQEGSTAVMFYQVNLELVQIESNRKVWIGEKKIKKQIKRNRTKL